jgi:hypothetical protein
MPTPDLTGPVGDSGQNKRHEVLLVQFMLKFSEQKSYYPRECTGTWDGATAAGIRAFQSDYELIALTTTKVPRDARVTPRRDPEALAAAKHHDKPGLVEPRSRTWKELLYWLPEHYAEVRTVEGVDLVYYGMQWHELAMSLNEVRGNKELASSFRDKIADLVQRFHQRTEIAMRVEPAKGFRRPFGGQKGVKSDANPGESVHQYGYAVDLGFKYLRWVDQQGVNRSADFWLNGMPNRVAKQLWAARNKIALVAPLSLYLSKFPEDIHLQAFDDDKLDSAGSLRDHLAAVGPRKMKWRIEYMTPTDYFCDLGLGGDLYYVGSSKDIWTASTLSKADLAAAVAAKVKADPTFAVQNFVGTSHSATSGFTAGTVTTEQLTRIQDMLRAELKAAEATWPSWKPVFYGERRQPTPVGQRDRKPRRRN